MGTACTPSCVNIFMDRFEQKHIYPYIKNKGNLYLEYIDDIFFICKGTEVDLRNLFNEINKKHPSIRLDQKYSKSEIEFLNVLFYKNEQQRQQTTPFKKKADRQSYLHSKSDNPTSLKNSTPYSQVLRVKRICSKNSEFECNCKVLQEQFTERCYGPSSVETKIKNINNF